MQTQFVLLGFDAGEHIGPPAIKPMWLSSDAVTTAQMKNFTWHMTRQINTTEQNICGWTGFKIMTRYKSAGNRDTVGYLHTINAPATAMSTVKEVLTQVLKIKESLGLKEIVCVFDQALYVKAADITWKHPDQFQPIVLRRGMFHTICNFLGIIGKRCLDAGLHDVAVESEVIAEGSVESTIKLNQAAEQQCLVEDSGILFVGLT